MLLVYEEILCLVFYLIDRIHPDSKDLITFAFFGGAVVSMPLFGPLNYFLGFKEQLIIFPALQSLLMYIIPIVGEFIRKDEGDDDMESVRYIFLAAV